jgi:hypothetical protein
MHTQESQVGALPGIDARYVSTLMGFDAVQQEYIYHTTVEINGREFSFQTRATSRDVCQDPRSVYEGVARGIVDAIAGDMAYNLHRIGAHGWRD